MDFSWSQEQKELRDSIAVRLDEATPQLLQIHGRAG